MCYHPVNQKLPISKTVSVVTMGYFFGSNLLFSPFSFLDTSSGKPGKILPLATAFPSSSGKAYQWSLIVWESSLSVSERDRWDLWEMPGETRLVSQLSCWGCWTLVVISFNFLLFQFPSVIFNVREMLSMWLTVNQVGSLRI